MANEILRLTEELEEVGAPLGALEHEFALLVKRATVEDHHAVAVGARRVVESLVLHIGTEHAPQFMKRGADRIQLIVQHVRTGTPLPPDFWVNIDAARSFSNQSAHSNIDDVFMREIPKSGAHDAAMCVRALLQAIPIFLQAFPPPEPPPALQVPAPIEFGSILDGGGDAAPPVTDPGSSEPLAADELRRRTVASSRDDASVRAALEALVGLSSTGLNRRFNAAAGNARLASVFPELVGEDDGGDGYAGDEPDAASRSSPASSSTTSLAGRTVASVRDDPELRATLAKEVGLTQKGISRRLNSAAGNRRLGSVFPELVEEAPVATATTSASTGGVTTSTLPTYQQLGEMTVLDIEDAGLQPVLALVTGRSLLIVKRRLGSVGRRNKLVRRLFHELYDATVVAELSVKAARTFDLAPLLARFSAREDDEVRELLRAAAPQTKLGTLFPALREG
jgi:hypothetical protein